MSVIIFQSGAIIGPFKTIETLDDRLRADGVDYPCNVIGAYAVSEDDSLAPAPIPPVKTREELKAAREKAVQEIKVTTSTGKTFDGDETSQTRMARAIVGLQAAGVSAINWTLADNTETNATLAELTEALILAGQEQARLWPI